MDKPWFDAETGVIKLDEYVAEMPSFKKIMADDQVSDDEMMQHCTRVTEALRELEAALTPEQKTLATTALCELAVFYALQRYREINQPLVR